MNTINERIKKIITSMYGGNATAFAREVNLGASTIHSIIGKKQAVPTFPVLSAIYSVVVEYGICGYWLMTGVGQMSNDDYLINKFNLDRKDNASNDAPNEEVEKLRKELMQKDKIISQRDKTINDLLTHIKPADTNNS